LQFDTNGNLKTFGELSGAPGPRGPAGDIQAAVHNAEAAALAMVTKILTDHKLI
jgi:hypothetical protein